MQRFTYLRSSALACALTAVAMVMAGAAKAEDSAGSIAIKNYAFVPATKTVSPGATVTWVNEDDDPHTVTGDAAVAALNSPALDTHDKYAFTFAKPGVYKYFCKLHPHMQGEIIVQ